MDFLKKAFLFIISPSHSRTTALLILLLILAAVPLTVIISQQQQEIRQRASGTQLGQCYDTCENEGAPDLGACFTKCDSLFRPTPTSVPTPTTTPACGGRGEFSCEDYKCKPGLSYDSHGGTCELLPPTPALPKPTLHPTPTPTIRVVQGQPPPTATPVPFPCETQVGLDAEFKCFAGTCVHPWIRYNFEPNTCQNTNKPICCLLPPTPLPTPTPTPSSRCGPDDCGGPGACAEDSICTQVGSGRKKCECVGRSSLTPTQPPTPTLSPTPTPTPAPQGVILALSLTLEGIGTNRTSLPIAISPVTIEIFESNDKNKPVLSKTDKVVYQSKTGKFEHKINIGNTLPKGEYTIKIKIANYLKKLVEGIFSLESTTTSQTIPVLTTPLSPILAGDVNNNGTIDSLDYNAVLNCFGAKKNTSICTNKSADINFDGPVDGIDYNIVLRNFNKTDD